MTKTRRKLSSIRLTTKHHLHYMRWWVLLSVVNLLLMTGTMAVLYGQIRTYLMPSAVGLSSSSPLVSTHAMLALLGLLVVATLSIVALVIRTAHRIAGPYLALVRIFRQIREGNLSSRLHFRDHDKLGDVETAFNDMMDQLQKRVTSNGEPQPTLQAMDTRAAS